MKLYFDLLTTLKVIHAESPIVIFLGTYGSTPPLWIPFIPISDGGWGMVPLNYANNSGVARICERALKRGI